MSTETTAEAGAALVTKVAATAQYSGSALAVGSGASIRVFGYTHDEWSLIGLFVGMGVAVLGFLVGQAVNWYYKAQHLKLAKRNQTEFYD
jgi:hypothetical protein